MIHLPETHRFLYLLIVLSLGSALLAIRLLLTNLIEVAKKPTFLIYAELFACTFVILGQIIVGGMALAVLLN